MTIARLTCWRDQFYVGHTVEVDRRAFSAEPDDGHPDGHPDGHGVAPIERVVRTTTVTYITVD